MEEFTRFIEAQESTGQRNLVNSARLPIKGEKDWQILNQWGVQKLANLDDLFCDTELPQGWRKEASEHSMWSYLLDERGLRRASIFYKAAFYDREAAICAYEKRFIGTSTKLSFPGSARAAGVFDKGLDRIVETLEPIYFAFDPDRGLGAVMGDVFYFHPRGRQYKEEFAKKIAIKDSNASQVSDDEFYERYHNARTRNMEVITAIEALLDSSTEGCLKKYPQGVDQWDAKYDFPSVLSF